MVDVNEDDLLVITISGKVIRIKTTDFRPLSRATQGVKIIQLEEGDRVCSVAKVREDWALYPVGIELLSCSDWLKASIVIQ